MQPVSPEDERELLTRARAAKEWLTDHDKAQIAITLTSGESIKLDLDRATLDELTQSLVAKTLLPMRKAMRDAEAGLKIQLDDLT